MLNFDSLVRMSSSRIRLCGGSITSKVSNKFWKMYRHFLYSPRTLFLQVSLIILSFKRMEVLQEKTAKKSVHADTQDLRCPQGKE